MWKRLPSCSGIASVLASKLSARLKRATNLLLKYAARVLHAHVQHRIVLQRRNAHLTADVRHCRHGIAHFHVLAANGMRQLEYLHRHRFRRQIRRIKPPRACKCAILAPMHSRKYWLCDITLSDAKEHTTQMNAFLLLIPLFHASMQTPNEGQLQTAIPFLKYTLLFNMNTNEEIQRITTCIPIPIAFGM